MTVMLHPFNRLGFGFDHFVFFRLMHALRVTLESLLFLHLAVLNSYVDGTE
jgi:hypothetical protein